VNTTVASSRWKFFRAGGLDQVLFRDGRDIANLERLDQKLWVALSCPTRGVEFDTRTLDLIDTDNDGRIRAPELLAAIRWTVSHLRDPADLTRGGDPLPLAAINAQEPSGAKLLAGARRILASLGKGDAAAISLADTTDTSRVFAQTPFNGDGVVPPASAADAESRELIEAIIATVGGATDRNDCAGVNAAALEAFLREARAFSGWWAEAEADPAILPLGANTAAAFDTMTAVRGKVEDYFARCAVAAFEPRAAAPLNPTDAEFANLAAKDLTIASGDIAKLPLARVEPDRPLPLADGVNPAWAAAIGTFRAAAVVPLLGGDRTVLSRAEWFRLVARLAPYETWLVRRAGAAVEKLGLSRVRTILAGGAKDRVVDLIRQDAALEPEYARIHDLEKLIRFYRDLHRLACNYVNLSDFYDPALTPVFQIGRLHMDGRTCDLCFHVEDMAKHATLAAPSKIYLAYCEITRPATGQKKTICAAFTSGFAESLTVGRNGIFYDRQGNDWDAVILKVVENPISLKEAFWSPWKKIAAMVSDQVKKLLAGREAAALAAASRTVEGTGKAADTATAPAVRMDGAAMASSVAAIGIAVGLLGSAVAGLVSTVSGLPLWKTLAGVVLVILAVSGPAMVLAYFKLRARDLAPILNAGGWAVNSRIRMTLSLGRVLTREAELPEGAERQLRDPYADPHGRRNLAVLLLLLAAIAYALWRAETLDRYLPGRFRHAAPGHSAVSPAPPPSQTQ
jgi:hypothetical protein